MLDNSSMSRDKITACVTSPPTDISLKFDNQSFKLTRDETGAWSGTHEIQVGDNVAMEFRATGVPNAPWTLTIQFTAPLNEHPIVNYKKDGTVPLETLMSILKDTIKLKDKPIATT